MEFTREQKGRLYRRSADAVTYGRTILGNVVAINMLTGDRLLPKTLRHHSVGAALGVGVLGAMDKIDGIFARKAEENGIPITREDKERDPEEDKKFNRRLMLAISTREFIGGCINRDSKRILFAGILVASLYQTEDRNLRMEMSRRGAVEGADTGAIAINKWKTGVQNLGHTLAVSPIAETTIGQKIVAFTYFASNIMGEMGLRKADEIHRGEVFHAEATKTQH